MKRRILFGFTGIIAIIMAVIVGLLPVVTVGASTKYLSIDVSSEVFVPQFKGVEYKNPPSTSQTATNNYEMNLSGETVHIGSATNLFTPSIRFNRFGNESYVELNLIGGGSTTRFTSSSLTNGVITAENNWFIIQYNSVDLKPNFNELGGVDMKLTLKRAPPINSITFTYNHQKANAYLQPPLTLEEIAEGSFRPDYVVNSIAFYGDSNQVNNAYKTGKIGHLYRMRVTDANNNSTWADWGFGGGQSQITLTIDSVWLANAVYPVVIAPVGDTFGYTSIGGASFTPTKNYVYWDGQSYAGATGTATGMSFYGKNVSGFGTPAFQMAIYTYDSKTTGTKVTDGSTNSVVVDSSTLQWWTATFASNPTVSATNYHLPFNQNSTNNIALYYDTGATNGWAVGAQTFGTWASSYTLTENTSYKYKFSIYCTYTPAPSYDITETTTSKAMGILAINTTTWAIGHTPDNPINDAHCTFTLTNNAAGACELNMKMADFTGGVGWNIEETANPAADEVLITAYYSGQDPAGAGLLLKNADQEFYNSLAGGAHLHWDFTMLTGTSFTDGAAKSGVLTITAGAVD